MERLNAAVLWYQQKIGGYDKQHWEKSVEQKVLSSIQNVPKKTTKVKAELIDVDLVRGSTFAKAKPQYSWLALSRQGLLRFILLPLYYEWWLRQTCWWILGILLCLYLLQVITLVIYFTDTTNLLNSESLSLAHLTTPLILMFVLTLLHNHMVATQVYKHRRTESRDQRQSRIRKKKSKLKPTSKNHHRDSGFHDTGVETNPEDGYRHSRSRKNTHHRMESSPSAVYGAEKTDPGSSQNDSDVSRTTRSESTAKDMKHYSTSDEQHCGGESSDDEQNTSCNTSYCTCTMTSQYGVTSTPKNDDIKETLVDDSVCIKREISVATLMAEDISEIPAVKQNGNINSSECYNWLGDWPAVPNENIDGDAKTKTTVTVTDADKYCDNSFMKVKPEYPAELCNGHSALLDLEFSSSQQTLTNNTLDQTNHSNEALNPPKYPRYEKGRDCNDEGCNYTSETQRGHCSYTSDTQRGHCSSKPNNHEGHCTCKFSHCSSKLNIQGGHCTCTSDNLRSHCSFKPDSQIGHRNSKPDTQAGHCSSKSDTQGSHCSNMRVRLRRRPSALKVSGTACQKDNLGISSCDSEGETTPNTPLTKETLSKSLDESVSTDGQTSELEWEESMNTEITSGSDTPSQDMTESDLSEKDLLERTDSNPHRSQSLHNVSSVMNNLASSTDKVNCLIWEDEEVKKVNLTVLDCGWTIIQKVDKIPETCDYLLMGLMFSAFLALIPLIYRAYHSKAQLEDVSCLAMHGFMAMYHVFLGTNWREQVVIMNGLVQRFFLCLVFFFLLSVAERTFKQRLLYAKHFCYLTSSRRAKKYELPHFRLNKVRNIKTWLSLRSFLKKRGPQRSVDTIVSAAFYLAVALVSLMCVELLHDTGGFLDHLGNWELVVWCLALGVFLLRFMTLGTKINKKYRNFSVLITEQINLYLHMEQKPHKKDELMLANNVLKLAEDLLKEIESPFKISGLSANPFLYNITRVVILSAFSAVLTELLGFKLKLYKIKIRA